MPGNNSTFRQASWMHRKKATSFQKRRRSLYALHPYATTFFVLQLRPVFHVDFWSHMRIPGISAVRLDHLGASLSGLCLVHCVSMPLIFAFAPTLAHLIPGDEIVHRFLAFFIVSAGLPAFVMGFRRHKRWLVLAIGLAGMAVILGALIFGDHFGSHVAEIGVTMAGSLLLTMAHLTNRTFCRRCSGCNH